MQGSVILRKWLAFEVQTKRVSGMKLTSSDSGPVRI